MSLNTYNQKRHFNKTAEPEGKAKSSQGALRFVVQKHDASSLHYDFRLEMDGALKSWAVPKGPSLNPADKRLAMEVEDHPLDYRKFEGVIPEGEYGGGTVMVWDEGTYEPSEDGLNRKEAEQLLRAQWERGSLSFVLHGEKLNGAYSLVKMKGRGKNTWLLMKKADVYASDQDVLVQNRSVVSGKLLADIAAENGGALHHPEEETAVVRKATPAKKKIAQSKPSPVVTKGSGRKAKKNVRLSKTGEAILAPIRHQLQQVPMPEQVVPMLATLVDEPFDKEEWIYEIKWDGYRAVANCMGDDVQLVSRNLTPFTDKYQPVTEALRSLQLQCVLDGEIVAVDEKGLANFQLLQNWMNTPVRLQFYAFDIIWLDGYDLTVLPLSERKRILQAILPEDHDVVRYSDHVVGKGKDFFKVALKQGLEGIMAKKANSPYVIGSRTKDWVKIKVNQRQEVVIAGFTAPRKTRKFFGSLLLGVYDEGKLKYVGHTGSGFNTKSLEMIYNRLLPLKIASSPFTGKAKPNMPATWVKPELVCEIKFTEWTKDQMARHPIFMGLRTDKKASDVGIEKTISSKEVKDMANAKPAPVAAKKAASTKTKTSKESGRKNTSGLQLDVTENEQHVELGGHDLKLTNLHKLYWKKEAFSKGDMINYYLRMAPFMLPYLMDRPLSLNRHPNGVGQPNFFQKDVRGKVPDWMQTHEDFSESTGVKVEYLVCSEEATLIYMANLGCIEINPWHSRSQSWQQPDWCLLDLDPDKSNTFEQVMDVARLIHELLESAGAKAGVKTSGSTGIHIYIPLGAQYSFEQSRLLSELIVSIVNQQMPDLTSVERNPAKRKNKIYLDFMQNSETQTAAAPYSLRPKPGMPVSTPLDWSELKKGLTQTTWNANNIFDRVKREGDLFKPVLGKGINLDKVLKKLQSIL